MARHLAGYQAKRDFEKTQEPRGGEGREGAGRSFVVQKHAARRLHYDLRLEMDGVLKSWAVTRGPSLVPGEKRLAVHVEDHPLDYGSFEGSIPKGQYGGGEVIVWDRGTWAPEGDPAKGYRKGHLNFRLEGERLNGAWHLVRMAPKRNEKRENWLLIKVDDDSARASTDPDILEEEPTSVVTARTIEDIAAGVAPKKKAAQPKPSKAERASPAPARRAKARATAFVAPALARLSERVPEGSDWTHEIKFDGYRIQAHLARGGATLFTRTGLDWTDRFRPIADALGPLDVDGTVLDGEIVVEGAEGASDFSALQAALRDGRMEDLVCYLFDVLSLEGDDLRRRPLVERKRILAGLLERLPGDGPIRFSDDFDESGGLMLQQACQLGLEGIVSKRKDAAYRSGRTGDWIKSKCAERQEFVVGGFTRSTAARTAVGSLLLGVYEGDALNYVGRAGTGLTAADARDLWKRLRDKRRRTSPFSSLPADERRKDALFVEPELVVEIEFRAWTAEGLLRHASFKGLREDKSPREIVRETAGTPRMQPTASDVKFTHPDRIYWPDAGITKRGLADFYAATWEKIAPHITGRPLALIRCPGGIEESCFFQKHSWAGLDDNVRRSKDPEDGEELLSIDDLDGLMTLVQAGVLEIHPWGSTIADVERPERLIFDLDPGPDVTWPDVIAAAREVRQRLEAHKLKSLVKNTGGKGLHVVVPLAPSADWAAAKAFAKSIADEMAAAEPRRFTATMAKKVRQGRIFVDYLRNGRGSTAVAAFSTRARPGAPVSTPLDWDELSPDIGPAHFTLANLHRRLDHLERDPWTDFERLRRALPATKAAPKARKRR